MTTQVIEQEVQVQDATHLIVELSQETYDRVAEVVKRANERQLEGGFDYWLADAVTSGARARIRTWDDRDVISLTKIACNPRLAASVRQSAAGKLQKLGFDFNIKL